MFKKKILILFFISLLYQTSLLSKSNSFNELDTKNLSKYFSGIVAFENKNNLEALNFFKSSKILINRHDPYLKNFVMSLVLEDNVAQAINIIKNNSKRSNSDFFEAYILLVLDSLRKNNIDEAIGILSRIPQSQQKNRLNSIIVGSLKEYIYVFKNKKIEKVNKNFGNLSLISQTFQRCYLDDNSTSSFFSKLINNTQSDYSRYIYFYLTFLIEKNQIEKAKSITDGLNHINSTLLLSQGKSWIDNNEYKEFEKIFSCKNQNDVLGEFLFLISNLYSSQNDFDNSNFYLSLSNYLNPKFVFNLSLFVENSYLNEDYDKSKDILKNFDKNKNFYYWYRSKKEAQILLKTNNQEDALEYIVSKFKKIKNPNKKFIFDIANFYKNSKKYNQAVKYYSLVISSLNEDDKIKADLLFRRGGSFERLKKFESADKDLKNSLKIDPDNAYVLNYLAYSWLERDYKINEAITMLEKAYDLESDDPYIIDSLGWAYYLISDFDKAEMFLNRAIQLMPDDPIVNDHYGDILWRMNRKLQARYFWIMVLQMEDAEQDLKDDIKEKLIDGPQSS